MNTFEISKLYNKNFFDITKELWKVEEFGRISQILI